MNLPFLILYIFKLENKLKFAAEKYWKIEKEQKLLVIFQTTVNLLASFLLFFFFFLPQKCLGLGRMRPEKGLLDIYGSKSKQVF